MCWCSCWRIKQIFRACPALMIENFIRFLIWDTAWTWNTTLQAKLAHGAKSATELKKYQKDQHFSSSVVRKLVNSESTAWCGSQDTASLILGYLAIADTTRGGRLPSTSPFCLPPSPTRSCLALKRWLVALKRYLKNDLNLSKLLPMSCQNVTKANEAKRRFFDYFFSVTQLLLALPLSSVQSGIWIPDKW